MSAGGSKWKWWLDPVGGLLVRLRARIKITPFPHMCLPDRNGRHRRVDSHHL
ncbi:hypothetical protein M404DRAFT_998388 [Pisolithus tinctorius Marx 270]|uniref:Uncharacterized protein n=1 Tax=Pisolithus tinctorius Marx 270 TaxID=870435 RepID=A0A0C3JD21_PISTI|nr:hypothetical protein M404DRAFT_998388 [Pisolithus tinctorius Marx 270]